METNSILGASKAVLFDIDGTLIDSTAMIVAGLGDTFEHYSGSRPDTESIMKLIGMPLRKQMTLFGLGEADEATMNERCNFAINAYATHSDLMVPFTEAVECFELTRRSNIKTALVTSRNRREVKDFLQTFPTFENAEAIVCSEDVSSPKPAADSALYACAQLGVKPEDACFVGDSLFDLGCARSANVPFIGVAYGAASAQVLLAENPEELYHTPTDLKLAFQNAFQLTLCETNELRT
jgi:pyrophosphatase PpaX